MREGGIVLAMIEQSSDRMKSRYFDTTPPAAASYERLPITECVGPLKFYGILILISVLTFGVGLFMSPDTWLRIRLRIASRWRMRTSRVVPEAKDPKQVGSKMERNTASSQRFRTSILESKG